MSLPTKPHCAPIPSPRRTVLFLLLPLLLALAVHSPSLENGLIGWDDPATISSNPLLRKPSLSHLFGFFTGFYRYDYYPVFYLSLWPERLLWGNNPFGHHLGNLLLHSLNAVLVYSLALVLLPKNKNTAAAAALAAAAWAIHPITAEPVAWATGRKVLLAAFFCLLSLRAFLTAARGEPRPAAWRAAALLFFVLACLSNVAGAAVAPLFGACEFSFGRRRLRPAFLKALPFLLVGILALALKLYGRRDHPEAPPGVFWLSGEWLATALSVFGRNLATFFFPLRLSPRYASALAAFPWPAAFWLGLSAALLAAAGVKRFRPEPERLFALLWFVLALSPTYGILRHHIFRADRFLYFPAIGLFLLLGAAAGSLAAKTGIRRRPLAAALVALISFEALLTLRQNLLWRDEVKLWSRSVLLDPANAVARDYLGAALLGRGRIEEAIVEFRRAIALKPWIADTHRNLGLALRRKRDIPGAIAAFREAIMVQPRSAEAHFSLAEILVESGREAEGLAEYREAIRWNPEKPEYRGGMAYALERRGDYAGAERLYRETVRAFPESFALRNLLGINLFQQGKTEAAIVEYREALSLNPGFAEAWSNLANAYAKSGRREEAIQSYRRAIALQPNFASALGNLGAVLAQAGRWEEAEESLLRAKGLNPSSPAIAYHLGTLFIRRGRFLEAERSYREALRLDPGFSEAVSNLAAVLSARGREGEAIQLLEKSIAESSRRGDEAGVRGLNERLGELRGK